MVKLVVTLKEGVHSHPWMEKKKKIDADHVIIDKAVFIEILGHQEIIK